VPILGGDDCLHAVKDLGATHFFHRGGQHGEPGTPTAPVPTWTGFWSPTPRGRPSLRPVVQPLGAWPWSLGHDPGVDQYRHL